MHEVVVFFHAQVFFLEVRLKRDREIGLSQYAPPFFYPLITRHL